MAEVSDGTGLTLMCSLYSTPEAAIPSHITMRVAGAMALRSKIITLTDGDILIGLREIYSDP